MPEPSRNARSTPRRRARARVTTPRGSLFTVNVSAGGFCIEMLRVLPVGAPMEGLIYLDGCVASFAGLVVWKHAGDSRLNLVGQVGVRFVRVDPEFARHLSSREIRGGRGASVPAGAP